MHCSLDDDGDNDCGGGGGVAALNNFAVDDKYIDDCIYDSKL